ncbi:hypothetical protein RMATCC62417_03872 [Rhizopus microsporus]|nr:hypothetical protein RMATCC62417_03872 [Rhizopus microsporus]
MPYSRRRPLLRTCDIANSHTDFFDYIGMVVALHELIPNKIIITLTDFTENPRPYESTHLSIDYRLVIQATVWDGNTIPARNLSIGDFVLLEDVMRKNINGVLTFTLHGKNIDRLFVHKLARSDIRLKDLLERKRVYEEERLIEIAREESPADQPTIIDSEVLTMKPTSTIEEILEVELPKDDNNSIYVANATIKDYKPKPIEKWVWKWCDTCQKRFDTENHSTTCPICDAAFEYIFQIAFLLENNGLVLLAYAFNQYCKNLFPNYTPKEVYENEAKRRELEIMVNSLCNERQFRIGLKSYRNPREELSFAIVNTKFIIE